MAARNRWSDVKLGIFVLIALGILIAGSLWIAGGRLFAARLVPYQVLLDNSGGVVAGDRVRVAGVAVGRIQEVVLRPDAEAPVLMHIAVKEDVGVHQDASALIATSGILGTSFLQILLGSPDSPILEPGSTIRGERSPGMDAAFGQLEEISEKLLGILDQTSGMIEQLSSEITPLMARLQALLSEENTENLEAILVSTRATLDEVSPRIGPLLERLDAVAVSMETSIAGVPALTEETSALVADLRTALGPGGERVSLLLDSANTTLGSADQAMQVVLENRATIEESLRDLEATLANLKAFSDRVKQQPSSLLRSAPQRQRAPGDPAQPGRRDSARGAPARSNQPAPPPPAETGGPQ